ncbi:MAG: nitroreductase [Ferruginibacter sp.]
MNEAAVLKQIIENRKSLVPKEYSSAAIPDDVLEEILGSAHYAPNHKRTKPWRFKVFRKEEKQQLGEIMAAAYQSNTPAPLFLEKKYADIKDKVNKSDTVIAIVVNFSGLLPQWEEVAATAMAVQNMYLTCTVHHVGCYWSTPEMKDQIGSFLQLEDNQQCYGFFYMGMMPRQALK